MSEVTGELTRRLTDHIVLVESQASTPLDLALFEECTIFGAHLSNNRATLIRLATSLTRLLTRLQQDPTPVVRLLLKLVQPLTFSDVLSQDPPIDFVAGLHVSAQLFNPLVLTLLNKAATNTKDAAVVAGMPGVVQSLVYLWFATPDIGIANTAAQVLLGLLTVDQAPADGELIHDNTYTHQTGQGLMWRRFFGDRDVYGLLFSFPGEQALGDQALGKRERSIAQTRLLDMLPKLGVLSWNCLIQRHHIDIESSFGSDPKTEGLLGYACAHLVDFENDVLVHMNLLQFYAELILTVRSPAIISTSGHTSLSHTTSVSLEFLRSHGHHDHTFSFYLEPNNPSHDPVDREFLYGPAANYLSVYASEYPQALLGSSDINKVLRRLMAALDIPATQWTRGEPRKHDLNVLASLPRVALLPQHWLGMGRQSSPLQMVPCKNTNAYALDALATIFGGPEKRTYKNDADGRRIVHLREAYDLEAAAAYAAYVAYLHYHDTFFTDLLIHADIVTLPEKAVAACNLLTRIVNADFHPLPSVNNFTGDRPPSSVASLPDAATLTTALRIPPTKPLINFTTTNINGILVSPVREKVLPWLLRPREEDGSTIQSKYGHDSANYIVWNAQWNVFAAFYERLKKALDGVPKGSTEEKDLKGVLQAAEVRYRREDPKVWRPAGAEASVATLGM